MAIIKPQSDQHVDFEKFVFAMTCGAPMIEPLSFLRIADAADDTIALLALDPRRNFPEDATTEEINGLLFRRGLRRCPHGVHDTEEAFGRERQE
jgi:hypothetical protein